MAQVWLDTGSSRVWRVQLARRGMVQPKIDGPDIILWGSSTLTSMLLEHGLADRRADRISSSLRRVFNEEVGQC